MKFVKGGIYKYKEGVIDNKDNNSCFIVLDEGTTYIVGLDIYDVNIFSNENINSLLSMKLDKSYLSNMLSGYWYSMNKLTFEDPDGYIGKVDKNSYDELIERFKRTALYEDIITRKYSQ